MSRFGNCFFLYLWAGMVMVLRHMSWPCLFLLEGALLCCWRLRSTLTWCMGDYGLLYVILDLPYRSLVVYLSLLMV